MNDFCRFMPYRQPSAGLPYPLFEKRYLKQGEEWNYTTLENEIIFSHYGRISLPHDETMDTGDMIILPPGCSFTVRAETTVSLFLLRARKDFRLSFCTGISATIESRQIEFQSINIPENVQLIFTLLMDEQTEGLLSHPYIEMKILELFTLLKAYYPKEVLISVFFPFFQYDSSFIVNIWKHYDKIKTVRQLAEACHCSTSSFQSKFKSTFGISPHKWMTQRKVKHLKREVLYTNKSFSRIAEEQGFSSPSQFSDYCKKNLGLSPDNLRKMNYNCV